MSIRTIKLPYLVKNKEEKSVIKDYIVNYNNVLHFTYNRMKDSDKTLTTKKLTELQNNMNHIFIDSHFKNSAIYDAKTLKDKEKVIFGGKKLFIDRCKGKITKEEYKEKKLVPINSIGEANQKGNRKFRILSENTIQFQPTNAIHILLTLPKLRKNIKKDILKLKELQDNKVTPITYKLDLEYIYISFNNEKVQDSIVVEPIPDRIFAIDINPNYIGYTIVDWKDSDNYKVIESGVISNKELNDRAYKLHKGSNDKENLYINNKRKYENTITAKFLCEKAYHYHCEIFALEKLDFESKREKVKQSRRTKRIRRLINNQWDRHKFFNLIEKRCNLYGIRVQTVVPNYSSFIGNLVYRETGLPDMCLASIEIGRRAYEFSHQYIKKDKKVEKNIVFNTSVVASQKMIQSLEELGYDGNKDVKNINNLYKATKIRNLKYRVSLEDIKSSKVCSRKHKKSNVYLYKCA